MNALMAKLTNLAEGMEETQADLQEKTYVVEGIAKGIKQAMAVIQQHLDHAEEIQAQDDEAARDCDPRLGMDGRMVYLHYNEERRELSGVGVIRTDGGGHFWVEQMSSEEAEECDRAAQGDQPDDFPHLDPDGEPGEKSAAETDEDYERATGCPAYGDHGPDDAGRQI